jgi:sterol desaturase/sphingolipid hydroxylase (fatty acid hydroxylase superfamily)
MEYSLGTILLALGIYFFAHVLLIAIVSIFETKFSDRKFPNFSRTSKMSILRIYSVNYIFICTLAFVLFYQTGIVYFVHNLGLPKKTFPNLALGGMAIFLLYSFLIYWWHRLLHQGILWKFVHYIHHQPQKVTAVIAEYKHPFEYFAGVIFFYLTIHFLPIDIPQNAVGSVMIILADVFSHANIKTPQWLGYFLVRPEAHRLHHQKEPSNCNYSFFPLWDIVFGTFKNPKEMNAPCGTET